MKALGVGLGAVGWHDIEVRREESGAPTLAVSARAARAGRGDGCHGMAGHPHAHRPCRRRRCCGTVITQREGTLPAGGAP